jgi:hypothetical protein
MIKEEKVGLTPHPHLVLKVLEKSRAIPLLTLRTCVACKRVETYLKEAKLDLFPFAQFVTSENPTERNCLISAFEYVAGT